MFKHTQERDPLSSLGEGQAERPEEQGAFMAGLHPCRVIAHCGQEWHMRAAEGSPEKRKLAKKLSVGGRKGKKK